MKRYKIPFIFAIAIASIITLSASDRWMTPLTADGQWWDSLTYHEQGFFLVGYIAANTVWAEGIYEASQASTLTPPTRHIYELLAPLSTYSWNELAMAINAHYADDPRSDRPIWQVMHGYADTAREDTGGNL